MENLSRSAQDGQAVKVSIRPEEFIISREDSGGIPAVVRSSVFLGITTHYFVETADGREMEVIQNSDIWDIIPDHTPIRLGVQPHKINVFTEDAVKALLSGGTIHEICRREKIKYMGCNGTGNPGPVPSLRGLPLVLVLYKSVLSEDGNLSFAYFTKFFARKYYWSTW